MDIRNTAPLVYDSGGIWRLTLGDYSRLSLSGGEINSFDIGNYATAILSGGRTDKITGYYYSASVEHIQIICKAGYNYNTTTKKLTGVWGNDMAFNIQLIDIGYGYTPTYNNIKFTIIPEPATLLLLALGGLLLRERKGRQAH